MASLPKIDSLVDHFQKSLIKAMIPEGVETDTSKIENLGKDLAEGIAGWLVKQEFRMTKGKLVIDLETFTTTKGQNTQIKSDSLLGPYQPIFGFLKKIGLLAQLPPPIGTAFKPIGDAVNQTTKAVDVAGKIAAKDGATTDPFKLSKKQGGLDAKGYAHVGTGEVPDEGLGDETVIQLKENEIKSM